jgi:hypothetical protein
MNAQLINRDGRKAPMLFCDVCGGAIRRSEMAMVKWRDRTTNTPVISELKFCHKGLCDHESGNPMDCWMELDHFMARLLWNMHTNIAEAMSGIEELQTLS